MKAIVLSRAEGKTARMLRWLITGENRVLIVMSRRERDRLVRVFAPDGEPVPAEADRIVTIDDVMQGRTRGRWPSILPVYGIDELDQVLSGLLHGPVEVVAFTGEVER